jgi:iron complex transport system permease protein
VSLQPLTPRRYAAQAAAWVAAWLVVAAAAVVLGGKVWAWPSAAQRLDALRDALYGTATASAVGGALALAGLALQALLRNPLASPYILGVSGGASLGVILSGLFVSVLLQPVFGFAGALATIGLVYAVAQRRGRLEPYTLLLTGVIVNAFYAALIMLVMGLVRPEMRGDIAYWMMGSIRRFDLQWELVGLVGTLAVGTAVAFAFLAKGFNLVAVGEETAGALGVRVERLRFVTFVAASLVTGAAVALAGPIGFVGLIVPHLLRMLLGPDHRRLVPAALLGGAIFLVLADLATSLLEGAVAPHPPPPVGVLTAMCGGPFFVYLLRTRWRKATEVQ